MDSETSLAHLQTYFLVAEMGDIWVLLRSWWELSIVVLVWQLAAPELVDDSFELLWLLMLRRPGGCCGPAVAADGGC